MLKETTKKEGMWTRRAVEEVPDTKLKADIKSLQRLKIQDEVFDLHDSVADNGKMISLLMSLIIKMYSTYTDTQKNRLDDNDRAMIESVFAEFAGVQTRADVQFAKEGIGMVTKILDRQAKIGAIVK